MRPIELVLENFGAYHGVTKVDFRALGELFLVWGKTGSGKTTLFDAMTYALYGKLPGSREGLSPLELHSHYAAPAEPPRVEFRFSLGGEEYRACRVPPHRRPGRGGRTVDAPQSATLEKGPPLSRVLVAEKWSEVDEVVRGLLGLSADEFSKIILLPQGEFQRFLEMSSSDRVDILEKLFPVDLHDRVTELALEGAKEARLEGQSLDAELRRLEETGAGAEGEERLLALQGEEGGLVTACEAALAIRLGLESQVSATEAAIERRRNHEEALARLRRTEAEAEGLPLLGARIDAARRAALVLPLVAERRRLAEATAEGRAALEEKIRALESLEARASEVAGLRAKVEAGATELARIDTSLGELVSALEAWTGRKEFEARLAAQIEEVGRFEKAAAAARGAEAATREALAGLRLELARAPEVEAAFTAARQAHEEAKQLERAVEEHEGALLAARSGRADLEKAGAALAPIEAALLAAESSRRAALAEELARSLQPGEACPVCGSPDHPRPAHEGVGASKRRDLAELRAERDRRFAGYHALEGRVLELDAALAGARGRLGAVVEEGAPLPDAASARRLRLSAEEAVRVANATNNDLKALRQEATLREEGWERAGAALRAAEAALAEAGAKRDVLEAQVKDRRELAGSEDPRPRKAALEAGRAELVERLRRLGVEASEYDRDLASAASLAAEARTRLPGLETAAVEAAGKAEVALAARGFADEAAALEAGLGHAELEALEAGRSALVSSLAAARAAVEESGRALGPEPGRDLAALREASAAADLELARLQARLAELRSEAGALGNLVAERRRREAERSALDARSGRLALLADLLAGNIPPRKLPFKFFVIATYFKTVVAGASLRLSGLSEGRYTLVVDEGNAGARGRVGLELGVRDAWTGRTRPSATLSGGERFLSSLALALGLADTIRSRSGGVSLEAIFIDEGFGSLDEETLDRALASLDSIRGDRMIGLVSHVAELRSRIPSRIEVRKGKTGSTIELRV